MARYIPDGRLRVVYAPAVADKNAPTVAEVVTAGVDLTSFVRELSTPLEGTAVDTPDPTTRFNAQTAGTYGGQPISVDFYRDDDTGAVADLAWTTLPAGTTGFIVIRRAGTLDQGALVATDVVEVWQVEVISRSPRNYSRNEPDGFSSSMAVTSAPDLDATVAA